MAQLSPPPTTLGAVESYATTDDVPNDLDAGTIVFVEADETLYYETSS